MLREVRSRKRRLCLELVVRQGGSCFGCRRLKGPTLAPGNADKLALLVAKLVASRERYARRVALTRAVVTLGAA